MIQLDDVSKNDEEIYTSWQRERESWLFIKAEFILTIPIYLVMMRKSMLVYH